MKLSPAEQRVFSEMSKAPHKEWTPEEVRDILFDEPPVHWRTRTLELLRWICAKTQGEENRLVRSTRLGRGREARYKIVEWKGLEWPDA